ncbi:hypothetical protein F5J12DRAFT_810746 [Pisolithus orientalis]|uniref:uncharacterized protein n=1 Tax=Pisolithus orientalis TaxID=936130 RepID=UPI002224AF22|nr:uncharacterized protein F5J12DRAFT_810746 [Pisolithus orientalis]KAI6025846.1 hypothetical protein F5J12DRAFT_810746 [Pisolithus orientalis]
MNQPRYSVLSLFDPLTTTPTKDKTDSDRDVSTPDSASGSDKENAVPHYSGPCNNKHGDSDELTMTTFFNRTYKTQHSHIPTAPLRKRLIDVGDATVTMEDASEMLSALAISEDSARDAREGPSSDGGDLFHGDATHHPETEEVQTPRPPRFPSQVRPPLVDISVDVTPVSRRKNHGPASDHCSPPNTVVRAPNFRPPTNISPFPFEEFSTTAVAEPPSGEDGVVIFVSEFTQSNQTSNLVAAYPLLTETHLSETALPSSPSSVPEPLPEANAADVTEDPAFLSVGPQPRPRSKTTSNQGPDPVRYSIDLQSSFNWQLQCPDASFDLLNDRISFFGGDSFTLSTDGDEFDAGAGEEMREVLAKRQREKAEKEKRRDSSSSDVKLDVAPADYEPDSPLVTLCGKAVIPVPPSPLHDSMPATTSTTQRQGPLVNTVPSPSVHPSSKSRRGSLVPLIKDPRASALRKNEPICEPEASEASPGPLMERVRSLQMPDEITTSHPKTITPPKDSSHPSKFVAPAPVQALRIVKRPKAQSQSDSRPTSVASDSSGTSNESAAGERRPSREPDSDPARAFRPLSLHRPVLKGVLRPPPGHFPPPGQLSGTKPICSMTSSAEDGRRVSIRSKLTGALGLRGKAVVPPVDIEVVTAVASTVVKSHPQKAGAVPATSSATSSKAPNNSQAKVSLVTAGGLGAARALPAPSRFATVSSGGVSVTSLGNTVGKNGVSGLPRPVPGSRLPMPGFGMNKSKSTMSGTTTIGRSGTIRR